MSDTEDAPKGCYVASGCLAAVVILVLLMIAAFAALFYFGLAQRGGVYDGLRLQLAQMQLDQLPPHIEMYRIRHGRYPDTLEELSDGMPANTTVGILDPSGLQSGNPARVFHYERVGDSHFILRSVGPDGIAFTPDDLVPQGYEGAGGLLLERPAAIEPPVQAPPTD